jgi:hypothetical protein
MTENFHGQETSSPHENQFLDPPIKPHDRSDEPEVETEMAAYEEMLGNVEKLADGYQVRGHD